MEIMQMQLAFPVCKIQTVITHFRPRKPTALEWAILEIIHQFRRNRLYRGLTLEYLFSRVLAVPDVDSLVLPSLENLVQNHVVSCAQNLYTTREITLSALEITREGEKMHQEQMLPCAEKQDRMDFFYDPLREKLMARQEARLLLGSTQTRSIASEQWQDVFPENLLRGSLTAKECPWLAPNTQIRDIAKQKSEMLWRERKVAVEMSLDSHLSLRSGVAEYDKHLEQLDSHTADTEYLGHLWQNVPTWFPQEPGPAWADIFSRLKAAFLPGEIAGKVNQYLAQKNGRHFLWHPLYAHELADKQELLQSSSQRLLVIFASPTWNIVWNNGYSSVAVYIPGKAPFPHSIYYNAQGENIWAGTFAAWRQNTTLPPLPLAYSTKDRALLPEFYRWLEAWWGGNKESMSADHLLAQIFWRKPPQVWQEIYQKISTSPLSLAKQVEALERYRDRIAAITPDGSFPWQEDIFHLIQEFVRTHGTKNVDELLASEPVFHKSYLPLRKVQEMLQDLLSQIPASRSADTEKQREALQHLCAKFSLPAQPADKALSELVSQGIPEEKRPSKKRQQTTNKRS